MSPESLERGVLIVTPPLSGSANMAIDAAMLANASPDSPVILRVYQWKEPTLSLGHFQSEHDRATVPGISNLPWVRRGTGGGAILHDHEITYSILVPSRGGALKGHSETLYRGVHAAVATAIQGLGWDAVFSETCTCSTQTISKEEPFLCFLRRSPVDLLVGGSKIMGSAQRRTGKGLLQHGSLQLRCSPVVPDLLGLLDLPRATKSLEVRDEVDSVFRKIPEGMDFWTRIVADAVRQGIDGSLNCQWSVGTLADFEWGREILEQNQNG